MTLTDSADSAPKRTDEPRQLALLALCSLALVIAAFAAPVASQGASEPDVPLPPQEDADCTVALSEDPVPGREITVRVHRSGDPVEDVPVWFNGRSVGVTNRSGLVEGTVPYVRTLEVAVGLRNGGSCEFVIDTTSRTGDRPSAAADDSNERAGYLGVSAAALEAPRPAAQSTDEGNATGSYDLESEISIDVKGEANPGERVTLVATVAGDPVPGATVSVDGEAVGTTGEDGRYGLTVPADGTSTLTVRVQRGEISGQERIDVRLLTVAVRGSEQFPLPGQTATARAAIGGDAVEGAEVLLDGEPVGTTDARGRAEFTLPVDATATVTVTTGDRTSRTSLLSVFAPTIVAAVVVLTLVVVVPLALYWAGGRRALAGVFGLVANLVTGAAGYAVAGRDGALFAVGSTILLIVLVLFLRRPRLVYETGESTGHLLDSCARQVTAGVLAITRGIEVLVDQTRASVRSMIDGLRSFELAAYVDGIRTWLAGLPGLFVAGATYALRSPRRLIEWFRRESDTEDEEPTGVESRETPTVSTPGPTIRELWRTFASGVVPGRWPQRTPGEVSRRAIDAGFPRDSVVELTTVFRDVEYGGESLSDDRYRRARSAFDALAPADDESTHDDRDGGTGDGTGDDEVSDS